MKNHDILFARNLNVLGMETVSKGSVDKGYAKDITPSDAGSHAMTS